MSLRRKLIWSIATGVMLTFLLGASLIYFHAIDKIDTEMRAAIAVGTRIASNAVDDAEEITNAAKRLELLVKDFDGDRHLRAMVIAPDGRIMRSSTPAAPAEAIPEWFYRLFAGRDLKTMVPLPPDFEPFGRFALETNSRNEIGEAWEDTQQTLIILAILTLFIASAVYWIVSSALRPLEQLADAFDHVGQSADPQYVAERGPEEFKRVYHGFNRMVDRQIRTEATNRRLNQQLLNVQEEERADIARDLHDDIGPFLFNVDVEAASLLKLHEERSYETLPARIKSIREAVSHMQAHVRGILSRLRPSALLDLGLQDGMEHLVESWRSRHPGIDITLKFDVPPLAEAQAATIFRIVQEAVSNAVRHGRPGRIAIEVGAEGRDVVLAIHDDGEGLSGPDKGGFGIRGMRERVALHDGTFHIAGNANGPGVAITARFPMVQLDA